MALPRALEADLRDRVHLQPVHAAAVGEHEHVGVRRGHEEVLDDVLFLRLHADAALAAAALRAIEGQRRALDVSAAGHGDDHVLVRDHVLDRDLVRLGDDLRPALVAVALFDLPQLVGNDVQHQPLRAEDFLQPGDQLEKPLVLFDDLLALQAGQALQAHVEDRLRLELGELPALDQSALRLRRRAAGPDQGDQLVQHVECFDEAFQDVGAVFGLTQVEARPAHDDLLPVLDEQPDHRGELHDLRLVVDDGQEDDPERRLHLRVPVEVVEDHFRNFVALELDDDADAVAVGLVAQIGDAVDALVAHQLGDLLDQPGLVRHVRDLRHDDLLLVMLLRGLDAGPGADLDDSTAGLVRLADPIEPVNETAGREIGTGEDRHQLLPGRVRVLDHHQAGVDDLAEVVRRDVGGHADGDAGGSVDEKVGELRRKNRRFAERAVVIGDPVDRFLVDVVPHQLFGEPGQPHLGVAHGRRRCRRRASRSCPGRRRADSAWRSPGPCARPCRRWRCRRADGTCP